LFPYFSEGIDDIGQGIVKIGDWGRIEIETVSSIIYGKISNAGRETVEQISEGVDV
jgi:hypothetical protein